MKLILKVKGFGKIKDAKIDITNFTIFVGDNNSGKTYMMQLIYGVLQELSRRGLPFRDLLSEGKSNFVIGVSEFKQYEQYINRYFELHKDDIVYQIFNREIPIEELSLELKEIHEKIEVSYSEKEDFLLEEDNETHFLKNRKFKKIVAKFISGDTVTGESKFVFHPEASPQAINKVLSQRLIREMLGVSEGRNGNTLYLPASRTGIILLYRYFFLGKDEETEETYQHYISKKNYGNEYGLSEPVYDFLKFLMRYTPNDRLSKKNIDLIQFIESRLIEGTVAHKGDEDIYTPQEGEVKVPLYLASSMVNELTPLLRMLTGSDIYKTILYDEIETCLHPNKQREMARLLMRLNNSGVRLIVSTHSDTMATKVNNLLLLSMADMSEDEKKEKLEKLKLEQDDLLKSQDVHVYQFANTDDGMSEVKELEFRRVPHTGFDFGQFMDSVQELYKEVLVITE